MIPIERPIKRILLALKSINYFIINLFLFWLLYLPNIIIEKIMIFNRDWKNSI